MESAAIQDTVEQQQVINLPLKGRQFIDLVGTTPGITHAPSGTRGGALQQTGQTWGILGQRGGHNLYLVDGVSITDEYYNNMVLNPSMDAIQEFNVNQTSYNAEFGGKSGGVINVITKSGSNRFTAACLNSSAMTYSTPGISSIRRPAQSSLQAESVRRQPGRADPEGQDIFLRELRGPADAADPDAVVTVPTDAERAGNFTGTGITVTNPGAETPFPNDTIPVIDPVAAAILAKVPQRESFRAIQQFARNGFVHVGIDQYNVRIDHTFCTRDSVFVRGSIFDANQFNPFGLSALNETLLPGFGYNLRTHTDNLSASWTHVFNTSWINELRFGWLWVGGGQSSPNAGTDFAGSTGLQGVTTNPLDTGYPPGHRHGLHDDGRADAIRLAQRHQL